jgi:hypothetical protein
MKHAVASVLTFLLVVASVGETRVVAQTRPAGPSRAAVVQPAPAPAPGAVPIESDSRETRNQLQQIMQRYPPDLGRILRMDPTMMQNPGYLAQYPALAAFLAAHPEVVHNPRFYLDFVRDDYDYSQPQDARTSAINMWRDLTGGFWILTGMALVAATITWLIKTTLNHRRWLRVSRVQTEVHNKLLDRFAGTGDLLTYVQTPAGRRFLEAAPIPLDAGPVETRPLAAPLGRILLSVQAGVVLAVGGLGFQLVSGSVIEEVAQGLSVIGVLAMAFGVGFILSGVVSYVMSRRLGLLEPPALVAARERAETAAD